ncbi:hypothetical protein LSAT2_031182 [Lamellibrachia satsuma]|nr:hypothetical protein LSAT2_031182 [Lamellibrachia satsuma]
MRTFNRTDNVEHLVNFIGCHPRATPSYIIVVPGVNMCLHSLTVNMMQTLSDVNITGPTLLHVFWNTADDSLDSSRHLSTSTT